MIDIRLLLDDFDATARRLARKGVDPDLLKEGRALAETPPPEPGCESRSTRRVPT